MSGDLLGRVLILLLAVQGNSAFSPPALARLSHPSVAMGQQEAKPAFLTIHKHNNFQPKAAVRSTSSRLYFFFGNKESELMEKELASFPKLATSNTGVKFEGLVGFLSSWAKKFEEDRTGTGLSTPVKVFTTLEEESIPNKDVVERKGVRVVFQRTNTGDSYKNKKEEDASERGEGGAKKKKGPPKEGGVQIQVEKLTTGEVRVRATRCDVDEDTTVKEMSEEAIVSQLKQAIQAWSKQ